MLKKAYFALVALTILFILLAGRPARADYGQYGGAPPTQTILVDKMVGKATSTINKGGAVDVEYVDNLTPSDVRFAPNQDIFFKVRVKNTSNVKLTNVTVKDFVPAYLDPAEGPGNFDNTSRIISFNAGDFEADEEKVYYFKMRIYAQNNLPADKGLFCLVNKAQAYNDNASDDDTSQFCIEKTVTPGKKVPSAGPELGILLISGELLALGTGIVLKKFKNG